MPKPTTEKEIRSRLASIERYVRNISPKVSIYPALIAERKELNQQLHLRYPQPQLAIKSTYDKVDKEVL